MKTDVYFYLVFVIVLSGVIAIPVINPDAKTSLFISVGFVTLFILSAIEFIYSIFQLAKKEFSSLRIIGFITSIVLMIFLVPIMLNGGWT